MPILNKHNLFMKEIEGFVLIQNNPWVKDTVWIQGLFFWTHSIHAHY